jgi:hypothetical protein
MKLIPINDNNSNFELVYLHSNYEDKINTPHCEKHGAMNKVSVHEDNGGIWRCLELSCRCGCIQIRK